MARQVVNAGVTEVTIRSVLTCNVCRHCYGISSAVAVKWVNSQVFCRCNLSNLVQLTMRTFHTAGGIASSSISRKVFPRVQEVFEARNQKRRLVITEVKGEDYSYLKCYSY